MSKTKTKTKCKNSHNHSWFTTLYVLFVITVIVIFITNYPLHLSGMDKTLSFILGLHKDYLEYNYKQMERDFKVYAYPGGDLKSPRNLTGKYASEGFFFKNLKDSRFLTRDPGQAHLFFIPISCHRKGTSNKKMAIIVQKYVQSLISKYPYWNRTQGIDHFFVNCHEIGVKATKGVPFLKGNAIQVMCSPRCNSESEFIPHKDIALPPHYGNDAVDRTKPQWEKNIQNNMAKEPLRPKLCNCDNKYPTCIAVLIHYGCVPVVLSNYLELPFNDILDWTQFAILVNENDVHQLKDIRNEKRTELRDNLLKVQKHFKWNSPPVRLDAFHMVMYSLWKRRHVIGV